MVAVSLYPNSITSFDKVNKMYVSIVDPNPYNAVKLRI